MKATWFAIVLSMGVLPFATQAAIEKPKPLATAALSESTHKINLNTVDLETLSHACHGIGKKRAEAIIGYRTSHGGFKSIDELAEVKGIGKLYVKRHEKQLHDLFVVS